MIEESENIIKKTCRELGITQKELAEKMGITDRTISNWANNKVEIPKNFFRVIELLKIEDDFHTIMNILQRHNFRNISISR